MTIFNTVPDKLPPQILSCLKEKKYDEVILFALAVFGSHNLKELINDASKSITNRMEEKHFHKWAEELIKNHYIEKITKYNEIYYKILPNGEDMVMKLKDKLQIKGIIKTFNKILGIPRNYQEIQQKQNLSVIMKII